MQYNARQLTTSRLCCCVRWSNHVAFKPNQSASSGRYGNQFSADIRPLGSARQCLPCGLKAAHPSRRRSWRQTLHQRQHAQLRRAQNTPHPSMLPSPPLTADSGISSPRSLKRTFTDTSDDATPPQLKRRRCSVSAPVPCGQQDDLADLAGLFDPNALITPPEYAHIPYDPDFGAKVCQQYKKSLKTKRVCDAVVSATRRHKYGEEDASAYSPGSTPDHIRSSYEDKQRKLDELAEDIIANSDSEPELESEADGVKSWEIEKRVLIEGRSEFRLRMSESKSRRAPISRDKPPLLCTITRSATNTTTESEQGIPFSLRSHDKNEDTNCNDVDFVSNGRAGTRCIVRARSRFYRRHRAREEFGGIRIAAS